MSRIDRLTIGQCQLTAGQGQLTHQLNNIGSDQTVSLSLSGVQRTCFITLGLKGSIEEFVCVCEREK